MARLSVLPLLEREYGYRIFHKNQDRYSIHSHVSGYSSMQLVLTPASRRLISLSTLTSPYLDNGLLQSIEYPLRMLYKLNPLPLQFGSPFPFARSDRAVFRAIVTNFFPSQLPVCAL